MVDTVRLLIGKVGLDGHDRGCKVIAHALRDAGFEVVYTGIRLTPEMIVQAAAQESVDGIGISILSGAHEYLIPAVLEKLKEKGMADMRVFIGGIIPDDDAAALKELGVAEVFPPGTELSAIVTWVRENIVHRSDRIDF